MTVKDVVIIDNKSKRPIYRQIIDCIKVAIENKKLKLGDQIPSINEIADEFSLAKGTITKAYDELKELGIIASHQGKGFYVNSVKVKSDFNVFMIFDAINPFKQIIFDSFIKELGISQTDATIFFHHYNPALFETIVMDNIGKYNYYVIMPHLKKDVSKIVKKLPKDKTIIIDNEIKSLNNEYPTICQSFENDILQALTSGIELLKKYKRIRLILSTKSFQFVPQGNIDGFAKFCKVNKFPYSIEDNFEPSSLQKGDVLIEYSDPDLISIIKTCREKGYILGKDVGLISYDDTPLKEILEGGITVISTDFQLLGKKAATMIKEKTQGRHENPFYFIKRGSL